ncbi:ATP-binding cassette domain-containing protein [Brachybacterium kimchii]|uniref:ATP-binding cassette domain-containing protein n=1 Tax=Brachybacterium kimchii TaxID=2942909 RepID=A0ABY4N5K5_9MICO|nr:ATP-binding cassette domain-containing protein [Brachybacterium kimchii]UQN29838.1 ATP-binding cassette domain-containing protein [Brachybacterium kimchii]
MIALHGLVKRFGGRTALDGVDLEVPAGTVHGLLGPNGAGKTTIVRVLTTLLSPDAGDALVAGRSVRSHPDDVRRSLGVSGQYAAVDERLTGFENLRMVARLYGMPRRTAVERARGLLADFRLEDVADTLLAGQYSGGMRRRLDLAGAVIARPPVVILDEPTTGLDPRGRRDTWDAVDSLTADGVTVLLTTQYLEEADRLADSISVIDRGRIVAEGSARELKSRAGGSRIDVSCTRVDQVRTARTALSRHGLEADADDRGHRLTLSTEEGVGGLGRVLRALEEAGIDVEEASLRQPTLDEVFLALTGDQESGGRPSGSRRSPESEPAR